MANWVLVDKDKLDADLTDIANVLRDTGGVWQELSFPYDFKSYIWDYLQAFGSGDGGSSYDNFESGEYVFSESVTGEVWIGAELNFIPDFWIFRPSWEWNINNDYGTLIYFSAHMQSMVEDSAGTYCYGNYTCKFDHQSNGLFIESGMIGTTESCDVKNFPDSSGFPIMIPEMTSIKPGETYIWVAGSFGLDSGIDDGADAEA